MHPIDPATLHAIHAERIAAASHARLIGQLAPASRTRGRLRRLRRERRATLLAPAS